MSEDVGDDESFLYGENGDDDAPSQENVQQTNSENKEENNEHSAVQELDVPPGEDGADGTAADGEAPAEEKEDGEHGGGSGSESEDDDFNIDINQQKVEGVKTSYKTFGLNKAVRQIPCLLYTSDAADE